MVAVTCDEVLTTNYNEFEHLIYIKYIIKNLKWQYVSVDKVAVSCRLVYTTVTFNMSQCTLVAW